MAAPPSEYQDLYSQLQTRLNAFDKQVSSSWDGATFATNFSAELLTANGNRGIQLLQSTARAGAVAELSGLRALGATAVVVAVPYPLLNSSYLNSIGRGSDYQQYLSFYKFLAGEIANRGMQMVVENGPIFPGVFSSGSGYDVAKHYASLSDSQYVAARASMAGVIAREIQPDYLQLGAEPDTEAQLTGKASLASVTGYATLITAALAEVRAPGIPTREVGAGVGTWLSNGQLYIQALAQAGVSFIDLHVYPVNGNYLNNVISYADLALSLGKKVTICEAWVLKERDSELGTSSPAADPTIFARDAFSFWAPIDQQFLSTMIKFSQWKHLSVFSAYWSKYLFAYIDYATNSGKSPDDVINSSSVAAAAAIVAGSSSTTGLAFKSSATTGTFVLSNSSYRGDRIAAESIISVFGSHLAAKAEQLVGLPPPTTLGGTMATITDSKGQQSAATFYTASPGQLNLILPPGLAAGSAALRIATSDGVVSRAAIEIAPVAPGISSANSNGHGVPAAIVGRLAPDGTTSFDTAADCSGTSCVPKPIDLSGPGQVYLALFGTGIRHRSNLNGVIITIGGTAITPTYAGAQSEYPGLDQINLLLPKSLAGKGMVDVYVTVDGIPANNSTVNFR